MAAVSAAERGTNDSIQVGSTASSAQPVGASDGAKQPVPFPSPWQPIAPRPHPRPRPAARLSLTSTRKASRRSTLHQNGCASTPAIVGRDAGFLDSIAPTRLAASGEDASADRLALPRMMLVSRS
jgi:hypothetical protein